MGSFFQDALGDPMISGGVVTMTVTQVTYIDGMATKISKPKKLRAKKSIQPLSPEEAQLKGYGDYSTNQFYTMFSLQNIPMPSKKGEYTVLHFNGRDWYVRKVEPFIWDEGTPMELGYYEITLSKFNETEVNPK